MTDTGEFRYGARQMKSIPQSYELINQGLNKKQILEKNEQPENNEQ
jgi:nanoRNase/pAp phosphatase (c-di-AMP/oligoRNAs hydrolase)